MTPKELKEYIEAFIPLELGTYTYKSGIVTSAIAIGNIPNDVKVDGIEVIIPIFPQTQGILAGDVYHYRKEIWEVAIVLHSKDKGKLFSAVDKLHRTFNRVKGQFIPQNSITQSLNMYVLRIEVDCSLPYT